VIVRPWDNGQIMSTQDLPAPTSTPPASTRLEPGQLLFEAPRRGKPPRHLADLTLAERKDAVTK
jgi:23S rRNA (adenine2503-C2)-methyltransferase